MTKITYAKIRAALGKPYTLSLVRGDPCTAIVEKVVNQGIDAHLEACYCKELGDKYEWEQVPGIRGAIRGASLECIVSKKSLPTLLRRLVEDGSEEGEQLAVDILGTLDIEVDTGCFEIVRGVSTS